MIDAFARLWIEAADRLLLEEEAAKQAGDAQAPRLPAEDKVKIE